MTPLPIRVVSLYDDVMNVYADRGNLLAVQWRAARRGVAVEVLPVSLGDALPAAADLILIGGGQDREQRRIADELAGHGPLLREWAAGGTAMLAVCGGFQLFGRWYRDASGEVLPGVGVFDVTTVASGPGQLRIIGDVLVTSTIEGVGEVVGFENHGGRTYLG
ncbi:MAG: glutamine amidotransferase, partial [Dehalococcoidia bacterium]